MDIERVNQVLVRAIVEFQDAEIEGLLEWPKKGERRKKRKRKGEGWVKKLVGRAPDGVNPLDRGSGIKGVIGRMREPM